MPSYDLVISAVALVGYYTSEEYVANWIYRGRELQSMVDPIINAGKIAEAEVILNHIDSLVYKADVLNYVGVGLLAISGIALAVGTYNVLRSKPRQNIS